MQMTAKTKSNGKAKAKAKSEPKATSAVTDYCEAHKLKPRLVRAQLRRAGLHAPYTEAQVKKVMTAE